MYGTVTSKQAEYQPLFYVCKGNIHLFYIKKVTWMLS